MKILGIAAAAALAAIVVGTPAYAQTKDPSQPSAPGASLRAVTGGQVGAKTRLAVFVDVADPGSSRGVNVKNITRPSKGLYCIEPNNAPVIDVSRIIPTVSADWSTSLSTANDGVLIQWRSAGVGCPVGTIAVLTFEFDGTNKFLLSNKVSFTVVVP